MNTVLTSAAIVTGGGRGLGRVVAEQLSQTYKVLIVGRTESDLSSTCETIRKNGGQAEYIVGDVRKPGTAKDAISKIKELGWDLEVLVNNAGIGKSGKTHEIDLETWHDIIDTNLNASFYFSKAVLPSFIERERATICFISSIAGIEGYSHEAAYVASKHGQVGLSKSIAKEYGKHGIVSVAICPGFIEGEMTDRTIHGLMERKKITYDEARSTVESKNSQKRIIKPSEVADLVISICSREIDVANGVPIKMDGDKL